MIPKNIFILLLALFATSVAQNEDELHIPMENDNQFPPDKHSELDLIPEGEGSGANALEEPLEPTSNATESPIPLIEDVQLSSTLENNETEATGHELTCPVSCVCNIEGGSNNYVVDCTNAAFTEFPKPLDLKTTELNLQNNKLTVIPQGISELKNLKTLNINNNEIMEINLGSISELSELTSLKLANNRLIEYPTDLKNSFGLTKLEELDLGGNDMRTALTTDTFINFKSLKKLTLPSAAAELAVDLCASLKESLQTVCTGSCSNKSLDCPEATHDMDDDLLDFALPGFISVGTEPEEYIDPIISTTSDVISETTNNETVNNEVIDTPLTINEETTVDAAAATELTTAGTIDVPPFRSAVMQASDVSKPEDIGTQSEKTDANSKVIEKAEDEIVGAATSTTKTGGVDKSLIAIIVAGMVIVVAGITIKKNWTSIRNRFSSSPRNANDRTGNGTANGTTPEEVPLQEKSPV